MLFRSLGFTPDTTGPICRIRKDDVLIDIMPSDPNILGFANRWAESAIKHAQVMRLDDNHDIRVTDAPHFLAMKVEAFIGRGEGDYLLSHDLEDVVSLVAGRETLVSEMGHAPRELQEFVADFVRSNFANLSDAIQAHLPPDEASQAQIGRAHV